MNDVDSALEQLGESKGFAVKAQVLTGGRGLGSFVENKFKGGVHVVSSRSEVKTVVEKMLGQTLVTKQTGEKGLKCNTVYVVEKVGKINVYDALIRCCEWEIFLHNTW